MGGFIGSAADSTGSSSLFTRTGSVRPTMSPENRLMPTRKELSKYDVPALIDYCTRRQLRPALAHHSKQRRGTRIDESPSPAIPIV